jgi:ketosteroid isomerase-like protein
MKTAPRLAALAASALLLGSGHAQAASPATAPRGPEATVVAFHDALERGDRQVAISLLLPEVTIFEGGEAELSRDAYAAGHLAADIEFTAATQEQVDQRESHTAGDVAWVLTRSRTFGTFHGREVHSAMAETMVLQRAGDGWRIAHVHWSSHATPR